ncbi:MAG TPA: DNA-deoxyinosine glycosylase [Oscillospiraceae bacterium]|nr:DNA-deoxyinosine glycosylase [Oscillospiraceae bacterium]
MPEFVEHTLKPIYNKQSNILILGTMPSPKSREFGFYYSHPQNRFWRVISQLLEQSTPNTNEEKTTFLLKNHIALWDVLKSCEIEGADDSSIKSPVANDIASLLHETNIKAIFTTGTKATALYKRLCLPVTGIGSTYLPSTSPANCRHYSYEKLIENYLVILDYLRSNNHVGK